MEGAQLGHGGLVLFYPALFRHSQPDRTAEKIGGLRFTLGQQGVEHQREAFASEISERKACFLGGSLSGVQAAGGVLVNLSSMQKWMTTAPTGHLSS